MIVTDYYSRWFELIKVNSKNANTVIKVLTNLTSKYGIPNEIVSDNVPFNSLELKTFCLNNDIKYSFISPKHSHRNEMVEKSVGIFQNIRYEEKYRNGPIEGISLSPAQLLLNRKLRTNIPVKLKLLKPDIFDNNEVLSLMIKNREKQNIQTSKLRDHIELRNAKHLYVFVKGSWE